jgi:hypothetical protein
MARLVADTQSMRSQLVEHAQTLGRQRGREEEMTAQAAETAHLEAREIQRLEQELRQTQAHVNFLLA